MLYNINKLNILGIKDRYKILGIYLISIVCFPLSISQPIKVSNNFIFLTSLPSTYMCKSLLYGIEVNNILLLSILILPVIVLPLILVIFNSFCLSFFILFLNLFIS